mmetsp:Transcript_35060/g.99391  ORF Transcript_35060/g.99391 Transcript_35060/m.99391 type:complete len:591 (-) Transcript_35060:290-2062(-)
MCSDVGGGKGALLAVLMVGVIYFFFVHDRIDYSFLPWNSRTETGQAWDDLIAQQAASSIDIEITAAELFPAPPSSNVAEGSAIKPPDEDQLDEWVKKVKLSHEYDSVENSSDKWLEEMKFFVDFRTREEQQWLSLEAKLNDLYGWYNGFYNEMLQSKLHINTMHEAPPAPPPPPMQPPLSDAAVQAVEVEEIDALEPEEGFTNKELAEKFRTNDTMQLLQVASQLGKKIAAQEKSIAFVRSQIKTFDRSHKDQTAQLNKARQEKLSNCEDDAEARRQVFLELHNFLDSIFQQMSEGLEAARVEALRIRNSPTDSRTADQEIAELKDYWKRRDPRMSHLLAQVMPEARNRDWELQRLNSTMAELQQRAKDIDSLLKTTGDVAKALMAIFDGIFTNERSLRRAGELLQECQLNLDTFKNEFEMTMKQKDLAVQIVQLAGGLAGVNHGLHPTAQKTLDGLAMELQELDGLDADVQKQAHDFKALILEEKDLRGTVNTVVAFVNDCSRRVQGTDLTITAGKAKIMNYYAIHKVFRGTADGIPEQLHRLDTNNPHPPVSVPEVKYDIKRAQEDVSMRHWWRASPPPPALPSYLGR